LDIGLNERGFREERLMNKKRCLVIMAVAMLLLTSSCAKQLTISLEAEAAWTAPLSSLQVTCIASILDGNGLSYQWSASGGNISGTGAAVNWTAPEEVGMYDITVMVTDGQGRKDTESIALISSNGPPPNIDNMIVTATGHPYLTKISTWYKVAKTYEYNIECVASDTGELVYEWSCTGGEISGEGSLITWTAPNTACDVTVTVKVFDGLGNWVRESIVFKVVSCVSCELWFS
jgi:hypothetical protein